MAATTWNSADKGTDITLSNGNLTAEKVNTNSNQMVRATNSRSSGKWFWEITVNNIAAALATVCIGVAQSGESLTATLGNGTTGWGWYSDTVNFLANNNSSFAPVYGSRVFNDGDVIGVALDMNAGTIIEYLNGVSQGTLFTGLSGSVFPAASLFHGLAGADDEKVTANFGATAFAFSIPSGYSAFDTSTVVPNGNLPFMGAG